MVAEDREHPKGGHGTSPEGARLGILSAVEMSKYGEIKGSLRDQGL